MCVENSVSAIQHIENRQRFSEVFSSPTPVPDLTLLHTVVFLHFTY